jgi:glycosyltransferase involved in cell wall biosynthesis
MSAILILNNYDLGSFAEDRPAFPDHYFYGVNYLHQRGDKIVVARDTPHGLLRMIETINRRARLHIPLGDLSQQWNSLPEVRSADLIYSPCGTVAQSLCYLRALGLIKIPIVCLAHHPLERGRATFIRRPWEKLALRGMSAFPSLSRAVAKQINVLAGGRSISSALAWGPDLTFYPPYRPGRKGVISAGREGRDFRTFGRAASRTSSPVTIVCHTHHVVAEFTGFKSNVTVLANPSEVEFTHSELIEMYSTSRAIAIPMVETPILCGLSSLLDALGMGRAVIMTRNPLIDIDIEAEGMGFVVAPGDTEGWQRAIQFIEDNPDEAQAMGYRARRFAEERCNSRLFAESLLKIIDRVLEDSPSDN